MKKIILLLLWLGASYSTIGQSISISLPLDRAVYQRNSSDQASITIAGQCLTITDPTYGYMIRYKVEQLDKSGSVISTITNWTDIISRPFAGIYRTSDTFNKGWYLLSVGQFNYTSPSTVSSAATTVSTAQFGVGEVIFTAGQSNIQGIPISSGSNNIPPSVTSYDCVSAFNSNCYCKAVKYPASFMNIPPVSSYGDDGVYKIAPNGTRSPWYYQAWGKWIAEKEINGLPVVFFNGGFSGSFVKSWSDSVNDSTISSTARQGGLTVCDGYTDGGSDGTTGQPYISFKSTLKFYGGLYGARGVVWHQGEADNEDNTSSANYQTRLQAVIDKSRRIFNADLGWAISRVSYDSGTTDANVIQGQEDTKNAMTNSGKIAWGAYYSDDVTDRSSDNTHFNTTGLDKMGEMLGNGTFGISTQTSIPTSLGNPISAKAVPVITVSKSGSDITLSVSGSYSSYCWTANDDAPQSDIQTGAGNCSNSTGTSFTSSSSPSSITVQNTGSKFLKCFVTDEYGNYSVSPSVRVFLPPVNGARVGVEGEKEEIDIIGMGMTVYPNPSQEFVNVVIKSNEPVSGNLLIYDMAGNKILKEYTNSIPSPSANSISYQISTQPYASGSYLACFMNKGISICKKMIIAK